MSGNKHISPVTYSKFRVKPLLSEGLLGVARQGGDLQRKVAVGLARLADEAGAVGDRLAAQKGVDDAKRDAVAASPRNLVSQPDLSSSTRRNRSPEKGVVRVNPTAESAVQYLMETHSLPAHIAKALGGHAMAESAMNTTARGDNDTAYGTFQWRGSRLRGLRAFAKSKGKPDSDLKTQLDYAVHELNTTENYAGRRVFGAKTVEEAVAAFMHFERPQGYTRANPRGGHNFKGRLAFANGIGPIAAQAKAARQSPVNDVDDELDDAAFGVPSVRISEAGPSFRPTGSNTIYGRSYDVTGTKTYLQQLDMTMREDLATVYSQYGHDPAQLNKALGELQQAHLKEHVFSEIEADYSLAFRKMAMPWLEKSRARAQDAMDKANQADFTRRNLELESEVDRVIEGLDPSSEDGQAAIASALVSYDQNIDGAVAQGLINGSQAEKAKAGKRSSSIVKFYAGQADGKSSSDIQAIKAAMRRDYVAGNLEGLDGAGWKSLDRQLDAAERHAEVEEKQNLNELERQAGDALDLVLMNAPNAGEAVQAVRLQSGKVIGGDTVLADTEALVDVVSSIREKGPVAVRRTLNEFLPNDANAEVREKAGKVVTSAVKSLVADPLTYAHATGVISNLVDIPVDSDEGTIRSAILARRDAAVLVSEKLEVPVKFFRKVERQSYRQLVDTDPQQALNLANVLVQSLPPQELASALDELGKDAAPVSQAGAVLAGGGTHDAARAALEGGRRDENGRMLPTVPVKVRREEQANVMNDALEHFPGEISRLNETAENIARYRMSIEGIDPKGESAAEIYSRSLHEAVGGRFLQGVQFGGFADFSTGWLSEARVLVPSNVRADMLKDVVEALEISDLEGSSLPAAGFSIGDLRGAVPVAASGGWELHIHGRAIPSKAGGALLLDFDQLQERMQLRTPEAFLKK